MPLVQPKNALHGITLEQMVTQLFETWGWEQLAEMIPLNCFSKDPSIASSLKFLRKTPWARTKVESLYQWHLRELKRRAAGQDPAG